MRLIAFILCFSISSAFATQKTLEVGLFYKKEPKEVAISIGTGGYSLFGNGMHIKDIGDEEVIRLKAVNGLIQIRNEQSDFGTFAEVKIKRKQWGSSLIFQLIDQGHKAAEFQDDFVIRNKDNKLQIVNHVYIEHYVAGVVESEAGSKEPKEYYKVQAVICRTYALNNLNRHAAEGFELCSTVHCQVYHSKSRHNPDIIKGTQETIGIVIVDSDINLVTAAFHSNCGGYTCNSEDVWSSPLSYLRARVDQNCLQEPHSYWRKEIPKIDWLSYLKRSFNYPIHDSEAQEQALNYCPDKRFHRLNDSIAWVDFKTVRRDWGLMSAYFTIDNVSDTVILEGRGYGHGVGLCQEGAMNMAKRGFPFDDILHYYYTDIHLVNLSVIDFFRSE